MHSSQLYCNTVNVKFDNETCNAFKIWEHYWWYMKNWKQYMRVIHGYLFQIVELLLNNKLIHIKCAKKQCIRR